ncbi:hypothetical protein [Deinococcus sonorensis]|uniref:Uncharacterized protein n=1 Tax=Deinococcus sonorensis TaxID=309891 RepID=A0ABV8YB70_9DEIO
MDSLHDYATRRLEVLAALLEDATPTEAEFYRRMIVEYQGYLTEEPAEEPDGDVAAHGKLTRLLRYQAQLQLELEDPSLGESWHRYSRDEHAAVSQLIEALQSQVPASPSTLNLAQLQRELEVEEAAIRVEELQALHDLTVVWLEQHPTGGTADVHADLRSILEQLQAAREELDQLTTVLSG